MYTSFIKHFTIFSLIVFAETLLFMRFRCNKYSKEKTILFSRFRRDKYTKEETIQERKLFRGGNYSKEENINYAGTLCTRSYST